MNAMEVLDGLRLRDMPWLNSSEAITRLSASPSSGIVREQWKYTPLKGFLEGFRGNFGNAAPVIEGAQSPHFELVSFSDAEGENLVLLNRILNNDLFCERYPLADLTALKAGNGVFIRVLESPMHPLRIDFSNTGCNPVVLSVAPDVNLELIETASADGFHSEFLHVDLGHGAVLHHARSAMAASSGHWSLLSASVGANASYSLQSYAAGAVRRRNDTRIRLEERGANVHIDGAYLVEGDSHLDLQTIIEHRAPDTTSKQCFHGIGLGNSRITFNGRIHIHKNAQRSDAALTNKNLALDPTVVINTKPELEIYTDDVACSHGATVGQLSEDAIFYLQSRGLNYQGARAMLATAFLQSRLHGRLAKTVGEQFRSAFSERAA